MSSLLLEPEGPSLGTDPRAGVPSPGQSSPLTGTQQSLAVQVGLAGSVQSLSHVLLCDPMDCSTPGLPHPWDSPGKNSGVGCHFLFQCMKGKSESEVAQSCLTLSDPMD